MKSEVRNVGWLLGDNLAMKMVGLLVTAFVAAKLGPAKFGTISYVLSTAALFAIIGHLGLQGLIQRELIERPGEQEGTLGTVFLLKMVATAFGAVALVSFGYWMPSHAGVEQRLFAIMAAAVLFQGAAGVLANWFHAQTFARPIVLANQIGVLVSALIKVIFVAIGASVLAIGIAHAIGMMLSSVVLCLFFLHHGGPKFSNWKFSIVRARSLLSESWMVFLGSIFAMIYMKIDLIMLRNLEGTEAAGVYAVAAMLSESTWFIPAAIVTSLFPRLVKNNGSEAQNLQELYDILAIIGISLLLIIWLTGPPLLHLLFGDAYAAAVPIMLVHALSLPFIFMRQGFSRWILISRMARISVTTQGAGAVLNILLNLWLIPSMGGMGAAIATVISYGAASYISLLIAKETRLNFQAMSRALFQPWRAVRNIILVFQRARRG